MQYSSIFTILALAMTATAAPSEKAVRHGSSDDTIASCNSSTANVCCDGAANCILQIIHVGTKSCTGTAYCCESNVLQGRSLTLVNVQANCNKVL
ncbi:hypothetical protein N658DRAFT_511838 [Parathielavia hyrcaniae]|uniref:Hydrophobin n=1 Tax=Parathielavia hyrcaniae TaxID=113614 RepID=A0AAN6PS50_9PEZI|nr:hypothetical protein N658DRAFT_511838 [Parathielavia hyrcaniae]